jgi:adenylosuccinate lyase
VTDALMPFSSLLMGDMVGTPEMRAVWSEANTLAAWIRVQRAIAEAQTNLGQLDPSTAAAILAKLTPQDLTVEKIAAKKRSHGHLMVSFLKAFREICGEQAEHFYVGPTTQDVLDTALVLQMAQAHDIIVGQTAELVDALCARAIEHQETVTMGRSHQQHTVPTTFGLILATWAGEIADHQERALESEKRWLLGCLSGISGAQNSLAELWGTDAALELQAQVCQRLGLGVPLADLHPRIDRFAEAVTNLAELTSSLGKIGMNLVALQRSEVGEVEAPYGSEQFSSSTSPNKVNPEPSEHMEGLAKLVRGLATAFLEVQMLDNRDATRMPVEMVAIPLSYLMASRALVTAIANIRGMTVHSDAMQRNLAHPNVLGQAAGERVMIALYRKTGRRDWAHTALHRCARRSREQCMPFIDVILADHELAGVLSREELQALGNLTSYTGTASQQTVRAVAHISERLGEWRSRRRSHAEDDAPPVAAG